MNNAQWRRECIEKSGEVRQMWSGIFKLVRNLHVYLTFKQKLEEVWEQAMGCLWGLIRKRMWKCLNWDCSILRNSRVYCSRCNEQWGKVVRDAIGEVAKKLLQIRIYAATKRTKNTVAHTQGTFIFLAQNSSNMGRCFGWVGTIYHTFIQYPVSFYHIVSLFFKFCSHFMIKA